MAPLLFAFVLAAASDAPRAVALAPGGGVGLVAGAAPAGLPPALVEARKLYEQLRYEEAVVEYQRYLTLADRPLAERAAALLELGFIHLVLGDQANAEARALEALELDPRLSVPATAPAKQVDFLARVRKALLTRARLEPVAREAADAPALVRVRLQDPENRVRRVLLRHALAAAGPYASVELSCDGEACSGAIPAPVGADGFTAWYFVEGLDEAQATVARLAGPGSPLQLSVIDRRGWYESPVVWAVSGAALVGIATLFFVLAPAPAR